MDSGYGAATWRSGCYGDGCALGLLVCAGVGVGMTWVRTLQAIGKVRPNGRIRRLPEQTPPAEALGRRPLDREQAALARKALRRFGKSPLASRPIMT
jgi:hypothetical protein